MNGEPCADCGHREIQHDFRTGCVAGCGCRGFRPVGVVVAKPRQMGKTVAEKFFTPRKISEDHGTLRSALSKMARRAPGESVTLTDQEIRALMEDREHPHLITTAKDTYVIAQKQACIHVEQQWPDVVPDDHERDKAPVFVQVEMMSVRAAADVRVWFNFKTDEWIFERVVVRDHDKPEEWKVVGRCDAWDGEEAK